MSWIQSPRRKLIEELAEYYSDIENASELIDRIRNG